MKYMYDVMAGISRYDAAKLLEELTWHCRAKW